jgi:NAD(P)-dependent dehydrogenase (short-subunit alcohol dehydrogenase family)
MRSLLDGKVVFVSGGSQGLGAAVAGAAVREGAAVVVTGRRPEPGQKLVAELAAQGGTEGRRVAADGQARSGRRDRRLRRVPPSDRSGVVTGSVIDWDQTVVGAYD